MEDTVEKIRVMIEESFGLDIDWLRDQMIHEELYNEIGIFIAMGLIMDIVASNFPYVYPIKENK